MRRPPGVAVVAPRVGAGLDRGEAVAAVGVGEAAADAGEVAGRSGRGAGRACGCSGRRRWPARSRRAGARTGRPSPSRTRPVTTIRSPIGSPPCWMVRSASSGSTSWCAEDRAPTARCPPGRRGAGPWSGGAGGCCGTAGSRAAAGSRGAGGVRTPSAIAAISGADLRLASSGPAGSWWSRSRTATARPSDLAGRVRHWPSAEWKDAAHGRQPPSPAPRVTSRVLALLGAFDEEHRRLTLTELGRARRAAGADRAPAGGRAGRVGRADRDRRPASTWSGAGCGTSACWRPLQTGLRSSPRRFLHDLYGATLATVHLAVRDGTEVLYLDRLAGHASVPVVSQVGSRLPLHATGVGQGAAGPRAGRGPGSGAGRPAPDHAVHDHPAGTAAPPARPGPHARTTPRRWRR